MSTGMRELTKTEREARAAIDAMNEDELFCLGDYTTNYGGSSTRATLANDFCDENNIGVGDEVRQFIHLETGALVIVPATKNNE